MGRGVTPGLTDIEFTISRGCAVDQSQVADEGVADRDARQCLVAGVLHRNGVADHFTSGVGRAASHSCVFGDVEARGLLHWNGGTIGVRASLVRVGCGQVDNLTARVDLALQHNVAGGVAPGLAYIEFTISRGCAVDQG